MTSSQRIVAAVLTAALTAVTAGCGSDDPPSRDRAETSSTVDRNSGGDRITATLDIFGKAASGAVGSIEGYEIDGSRIVFDATSIDQATGASHCIILTTAAGGVDLPADTEIVIEYSDGSTTCEMDQ